MLEIRKKWKSEKVGNQNAPEVGKNKKSEKVEHLKKQKMKFFLEKKNK